VHKYRATKSCTVESNTLTTIISVPPAHRENGRSQCPRSLSRIYAATCLLRLWVRIPPGGMDVCCECCVLSGRGLCDELIARPEESYRLWCVVACDLETSWMRRPWPTGGLLFQTQRKWVSDHGIEQTALDHSWGSQNIPELCFLSLERARGVAHCATSRKVAGSTPRVSFFIDIIDSASNSNEYRNMSLG